MSFPPQMFTQYPTEYEDQHHIQPDSHSQESQLPTVHMIFALAAVIGSLLIVSFVSYIYISKQYKAKRAKAQKPDNIPLARLSSIVMVDGSEQETGNTASKEEVLEEQVEDLGSVQTVPREMV